MSDSTPPNWEQIYKDLFGFSLHPSLHHLWRPIDQLMIRLAIFGPCPDETEANRAADFMFNEILMIIIIEINREAQFELREELLALEEEDSDGGRYAPSPQCYSSDEEPSEPSGFALRRTRSYTNLGELVKSNAKLS
jgi:hypothetical protein